MKEKVNLLVLLDLIFLVMLGLSGAASEHKALTDFFYYGAFIIPILIGTGYIQKYTAYAENYTPINTKITKEKFLFSLPLFFPIIASICVIAFLTNLVINYFGYSNSISYEENIILAIILHGLIPAFLEEMLFRYIPLNLLFENKKYAVVLSSFLFAFAHMNLFQIPYALFAAIALSLITLATSSILPAMLIHFLNNLLSLLTIYGLNPIILYSSILIIAILSIIIVIFKRKEYKSVASETFAKDITPEVGYSPLIFIGISTLILISNLLI